MPGPAHWTDGKLGGIDTFDHALDIVVTPDRRWRWKDEQEYLERAGHPDYWTAEEAAGIRAEGERVVREIEAGVFPFDGTWCDFRPDPAWPVPALPGQGWDRPRESGAGSFRPRRSSPGQGAAVGEGAGAQQGDHLGGSGGDGAAGTPVP